MQGKSRILILATSYAPLIGGAELAVRNLTDRLPDFAFDLITSLPSSELPHTERIGNVNVFRVGGTLGQSNFLLPKAFLPLAIFSKARSLLAKNSYDFIYVLQASQAGGAAWLLKTFSRVRVPIVLNLQDGKDLQRQPFLTQWMRTLIFHASDHFVVISNYLRKYLISKNVSPNRIHLIPNGVDTSMMSGPDLTLKNQLGLTNEKIIITVSRLVEKNGVGDLIKAFAIAKKSSTNPLKLLIAGDGELKENLQKETEILGIISDVLFVGTVDPKEVPRYLSLSDIFVRPSHSEGLGTAFLEAMAADVAVIGTPIGGIPDFLKDGETGLFCEVGNPQNIGDTILRLLGDNDLRQTISRQGQELVLRNYTWDLVAGMFRKFCETLNSHHE